ncbi:MAG: N-acetylmuramoyl-L-alanine amidase [Deltaproteobacteria bacterium]|nr:N-acetylmuramoyl-L-alanine amidase [Deltaproteobacteria bacterium]
MRTKANAEVRQAREARLFVSGARGRTWRWRAFLVILFAVVLAPRPGAGSPPFKAPPKRGSVQAAAPATVERVRYIADDHSTRVIVLLSRSVPYEVRVLPGEATRGSERRVVLDFSNAKLGAEAAAPIGIEDGLLKQIRTGQFTARTARVVLDLASVTGHHIVELDDPPRVVVDIAGRPTVASASPARDGGGSEEASRGAAGAPDASHLQAALGGEAERPRAMNRIADAERPHQGAGAVEAISPPAPAAVTPPEPAPVDDGGARASRRERTAAARAPDVAPEQSPAVESSSRAEHDEDAARTARVREETASAETAPPPSEPAAHPTPWRIVLDPGHGGNDPGTLGIDGVSEKDVTLAIAKQLKRRLETGLGAQVLLTRDRDVTRSLAQRTAFANASNADLFVSIHANADASGELHGIETYTLNNTNDRAAIRLAKMENGPGVRTGRGDLSFILSDMVQSGKEEESVALANRLQRHLVSRLRGHYPDVRSLGVKKGPFYVLVGAYMPCVLVETSFLSHPIEGRRLASPEYQGEIVEGLYLGMADFLGDQRLAKTL